MNRRKSMGPKMLPCGTPEVTGDHSEATPSTTTRCVRPILEDVIASRMELSKKYDNST